MSGYFAVAICLVFLVSHSSGVGRLENPMEYMTNVVKRMVGIIEAIPISGNAFPLREFESKINVTEYGLAVVGSVRFHSGFVAKMDRAFLIITSHKDRITDTFSIISAMFMITRVQTVYDTKYNLQGFTEPGAFTLLYLDVVYCVDIIRQHSDRLVTATIKWETVNRSPGKRPGQYGMVAKAYPDNGYTQLICRQMKRTLDFRGELERSFGDWETSTFQPALERAVSDFEYPEIRFYEN